MIEPKDKFEILKKYIETQLVNTKHSLNRLMEGTEWSQSDCTMVDVLSGRIRAYSDIIKMANNITNINTNICPKCSNALECDDQIWDDKVIWICEKCNYSTIKYYGQKESVK